MTHADLLLPTNASGLHGEDLRTLQRVFAHPLSHNLAWREVVKLMGRIGSAEEQHNGEFHLLAGGAELRMKKPHDKDLTATEVMDLRHFLAAAGWDPDATAAAPVDTAPATPDLVIVIDHAGARLYRIGARDGAEAQADAPQETHHFLHDVDARENDADREETYPQDMQFFEKIALAAVGGKIVVISHGTGQSNAAHHLTDYLKTHHSEVCDRIAQILTADLPHTTTPELMELARQALYPDTSVGRG